MCLTSPFSIKSGISTANQGPSWRGSGVEGSGGGGALYRSCLPSSTLLDTFHHSLFFLQLPLCFPSLFLSPSHPFPLSLLILPSLSLLPFSYLSPSLLTLSSHSSLPSLLTLSSLFPSLPSITPVLTPNAIACAMPNFGTFRAHNGLKWSVRQILPPLKR